MAFVEQILGDRVRLPGPKTARLPPLPDPNFIQFPDEGRDALRLVCQSGHIHSRWGGTTLERASFLVRQQSRQLREEGQVVLVILHSGRVVAGRALETAACSLGFQSGAGGS